MGWSFRPLHKSWYSTYMLRRKGLILLSYMGRKHGRKTKINLQHAKPKLPLWEQKQVNRRGDGCWRGLPTLQYRLRFSDETGNNSPTGGAGGSLPWRGNVPLSTHGTTTVSALKLHTENAEFSLEMFQNNRRSHLSYKTFLRRTDSLTSTSGFATSAPAVKVFVGHPSLEWNSAESRLLLAFFPARLSFHCMN